MSDMRVGDTVFIDDRLHIVSDISNHGKLFRVCASDVQGREHQYITENYDRTPRPGEIIEVSDSWQMWVKRMFICMDKEKYPSFPVRCVPFDENDSEEVTNVEYTAYGWKMWRLVDNRKEKLLELIIKIEENDRDILAEMAEIILSSREKAWGL